MSNETSKNKPTGGQGDTMQPTITYSPALEKERGTYGTREEKLRRNEAQRKRIKPEGK